MGGCNTSKLQYRERRRSLAVVNTKNGPVMTNRHSRDKFLEIHGKHLLDLISSNKSQHAITKL